MTAITPSHEYWKLLTTISENLPQSHLIWLVAVVSVVVLVLGYFTRVCICRAIDRTRDKHLIILIYLPRSGNRFSGMPRRIV
jgi:hypothetical protein